MLAVLAREGTPAPSPGPSCADTSGFCEFVYHRTGLTWLAESSYWVLVKPLTILLIVILALVVRFLIHRTIEKLIKHMKSKAGVWFANEEEIARYVKSID